MDFIRAANRAADGRSIIALQSTNRERNRSCIVAKLADGIVTTPRAEADLVVTEYGIAELRGRTERLAESSNSVRKAGSATATSARARSAKSLFEAKGAK
jgi:hypothetical protein